MGHSKNKSEKIENLKVKNAKIEKLCNKSLQSLSATVGDLTAENATVNNKAIINDLVAKKATVDNLVATTINGQSTQRSKIFSNTNEPLITSNPTVKPSPFYNQKVWDGLMEQVENQRKDLQSRLACGRKQFKYIENFFKCKVCPPNELENCKPVCAYFKGSTSNLPSDILTVTYGSPGSFGTLSAGDYISGNGIFVDPVNPLNGTRIKGPGDLPNTYLMEKYDPLSPEPDKWVPVLNTVPDNTDINVIYGNGVCPCPEDPECPDPDNCEKCPQIETEIYAIKTLPPYLLQLSSSDGVSMERQLVSNISYNLNVLNLTATIDARNVAVMVHIGYLDAQGNFVGEMLDFGSRQFAATMDTLYGEKYTGNVVLNSDLTSFISTPPNSGALIQLVIYIEDGLAIMAMVQNQSMRYKLTSLREADQQQGSSAAPVQSFRDEKGNKIFPSLSAVFKYSEEYQNLFFNGTLRQVPENDNILIYCARLSLKHPGSDDFPMLLGVLKSVNNTLQLGLVLEKDKVRGLDVPTDITQVPLKGTHYTLFLTNIPILVNEKFEFGLKYLKLSDEQLIIEVVVQKGDVNQTIIKMDIVEFPKDMKFQNVYIDTNRPPCPLNPSITEWDFPFTVVNNDFEKKYFEYVGQFPETGCGIKPRDVQVGDKTVKITF